MVGAGGKIDVCSRTGISGLRQDRGDLNEKNNKVAQMVKNPPAMQQTWVWSPGWEDPLEKEMATYSNILA